MADVNIRGVSSLAFALTPWAIGIGASAWLVFFDGAHTLRRELGLEHRAAVSVHADPLPDAPIKLVIENPRGGLAIESASWDGADLLVYFRASRATARRITLWEQQEAPDGTVVQQGDWDASIYAENHGPEALAPRQRGEAHFKLQGDPRAVTLRLRPKHQEYDFDG